MIIIITIMKKNDDDVVSKYYCRQIKYLFQKIIVEIILNDIKAS